MRLAPAKLAGFATRAERLGACLELAVAVVEDALPLLRELAAETRALRLEVDALRAQLERTGTAPRSAAGKYTPSPRFRRELRRRFGP